MSMEKSDLSLFIGDFKFAYDNVEFSDRILRIEIIVDDDEVSCSSLVDGEIPRQSKQRRFDLSNNSSETEYENEEHEEALVMAEQKSQSGGEDNNRGATNNSAIPRVRELYVCSTILAAKSPFFYKLFSNGMLESKQKHVTLKIDASEETAVMELLKFMYNNSLSDMTMPALLDVLVVADKFEVVSCVKYCVGLLLKMPMTLDSALRILHPPSSLRMADSVKPLTDATKQFIVLRFKNISNISMEELMDIPLAGMTMILASDSVEIESEDVLYDFVLKWAKLHYSVLEERQTILGFYFARLIRFPYMTIYRLMKILTSDDFTPFMASRLVSIALAFKEPLDKRRFGANGSEKHDCIKHWFGERAYTLRPIRIVELESPSRRCVVYMDLKREECERMYPSGHILSQTFYFGGLGFSLSAECGNMGMYPPGFGLCLRTHKNGSACLTVEYEFSARRKTREEFQREFTGNHKFTRATTVGCINLFGIPWDTFVAEKSPYFINGVLHLRADLSICL